MTTREEWMALAARCEAATGPDWDVERALDQALYPDIVLEPPDSPIFLHDPYCVPYPEKTGDIKVALRVVKREFPGMSVLMAIGPERAAATLHTQPLGTVGSWFPHASAATPAIALMAALCKAKADAETQKKPPGLSRAGVIRGTA